MPEIGVLVLTLYAEDFVKQAIEAGVSGYLLKDSDCDNIIRAIHQVHEGLCPIAPSLTRDLVLEYVELSRTNRASILTNRQLEILKLIAEGEMSYRQIARQLNIKTSVVGVLLHRAKTKLRAFLETPAPNKKSEAVL